MTDSYLSISQIANDAYMIERMRSCATQQERQGNLPLADEETPESWVNTNRYLWASSPTWGEKWTYALETHPDDPTYEPGADAGVITDGDILSTVQALAVTPEQ